MVWGQTTMNSAAITDTDDTACDLQVVAAQTLDFCINLSPSKGVKDIIQRPLRFAMFISCTLKNTADIGLLHKATTLWPQLETKF